jgi:BlaI family transcriptional regulator, penicillinase repressor
MPAPRTQATDAELAILKLLWEGEPLTARAICEKLYPSGTPSDQATVQKLLQRLEQKRLISRDRRTFAHQFRAAVTRESLAAGELEALAEKLTDGSLVPFILHAVDSKQLSAKERNDIRRILNRRR